ncbi:hypothetical protein HBH98_110870 [Parastagonospora nodorum]|nr:hypothetical protein HBH52_063770 [Parastagonospora nodorum]KAH4106893.1 hypothetical protein HBH46_070570 [Parastagonospora nodorum]KAH4128616.1 hypothetical protein HBH47_035060 [Parastagonospora nodorum]KAH4142627.1 hypothetical protein HBH45_055560 [Parastagonospora nodorum]KAH4156190.1 hypothetical protein HBH44_132300 [Parastagonospora nodorum]
MNMSQFRIKHQVFFGTVAGKAVGCICSKFDAAIICRAYMARNVTEQYRSLTKEADVLDKTKSWHERKLIEVAKMIPNRSVVSNEKRYA